MAKKMLRPPQIYGRNGRIPVSKTFFWDNIVYHEGGEPNIPNTPVPRLRLAHIGPRAVAGFEDEVDAIVEGLRKHRDAPAAPTSTDTEAPVIERQSAARWGR